MSDCEGAIVTVNIKNFNKRKRCPYCGEMPEEMEWSTEGLRIWCRNKKCTGAKYKLFVPIPEEELDLVKMTRAVIGDWGKYCKGKTA